ncbi:MAG: hydrogenase maturation nickel metallochaperone HypA [Proteobacteria bacterium]|nr:hydrogenase maturation nickel metallochaperone HypA [Pseudomonadota bacterium]
MHEMGIALQIIDIAVSAIPKDITGTPVEKVNLRIGKLSAIVPKSLTFCFEIASKDTPLEGATLHIEEVPVEARCKECGHNWTITGASFTCTECQSGAIDILSGRELDIVSIELKETS